MQFRNEQLIADLEALSTSQLRAAASYINTLLRDRAVPSSDESSPSQRARAEYRGISFSITSQDLQIAEASLAALAAVGRNVLGKAFLELVDPDYRQSAERALDDVRRHKEVRNVRLRLRCENGESLPVSMTARLGQNLQIDLECHDISRLKSLGNIEIFSEMLSIGIILVDESGVIAFANRFAEDMFGFEQGNLVGKSFSMIVPEMRGYDRFIGPPQGQRADREMDGRRSDGSLVELKIGWSSIRLGETRFVVASITDVSAHKSIEGELRKYEQQRSLMFSEGLLGDFVWTAQTDEVEAHPTVFRLYGSSPLAGPVPGSWFRTRQHPADQPEVERKWRQQMASGGPIALEFRVVGDDGVTRWIDCRGVVVLDSQGIPVQVHGLNMDITARKRAEAESLASEARARSAEELFQIAMQFSGAVVWRWTKEQNWGEWSGPVLQLTGRSADQLRTFDQVKEIMVPADVPGLQRAMENSIATGVEFRHEFRIVLTNGQFRWLAGRGGPLRDSNGRIYGLTGANFDITDRKLAEEELRQSESNFRQLTNLLPQIVFTADPTGKLDYVNERFYETSGSASWEEAVTNWAHLVFEEDRKTAMEAWAESMTSGVFYETECRLWSHAASQFRWNLVRALPVCNADGAIVRWIGTSTDIHDQKTASERLEAMVASRTVDLNISLSLLRHREEQLEKSLQEKDALLREIHHRVKNNLQIVSSLLSMQAANASLLVAAPLRDSERRISSMAMIHEQLYGTEDMQTVEFSAYIRSLSQSLLSSMAPGPGIRCHLDVSPITLTIHQAIPCALILNELLTNAMKYAYPAGPGGEITVRLSHQDGKMTLVVSDTGVGLPADVDPFAPHSLGLEIVHVLVQQLEGELHVAGSPGASFTVTFRPHEPEHGQALKASASLN